MINDVIRENKDLLDKYPILEIEYNSDGSKKKFYTLSSEKNIKETQLKSDENELEFNYSQNKISKEDYELQKLRLKTRLEDQNYVYDTLIFDLIKDEDMEDLREEIINAKLDDIELKRLAISLSSIAENKINDFQENNKEFKKTSISDWNYRYDIIAKNYAKTRELEGFILSLIK